MESVTRMLDGHHLFFLFLDEIQYRMGPINIPISSTAGVQHRGWFYWFLDSQKCAVLQSLEYILANLVDYGIYVSFWIAH
jgi:hypothetical protein